MKKLISVMLLACFTMNFCHGQEKDNDSKGIFKHFHIKTGLTVSYSWARPFTENWVYLLQADSRVKLSKERYEDGVPLSVVVLVPTGKDQVFNILFNLSLADIANSSSFYNTRIPFGVGAAVFPFKEYGEFIGFSLFCNVGHAYRMRQSALDDPNLYFPIINHPGFNLAVDAPVSEEIIKPFCDGKVTYSLNAGFVLRF